jgi:hypothetical protein
MPKKITDEEVFAILEIGKGDRSLRKLISGQRQINGSLYRSIEAILDHLKKLPGPKGSKQGSPKLRKAEKENDDIPGKVAPFCR